MVLEAFDGLQLVVDEKHVPQSLPACGTHVRVSDAWAEDGEALRDVSGVDA